MSVDRDSDNSSWISERDAAIRERNDARSERDQWRSLHGQELEMRMEAEKHLAEADRTWYGKLQAADEALAEERAKTFDIDGWRASEQEAMVHYERLRAELAEANASRERLNNVLAERTLRFAEVQKELEETKVVKDRQALHITHLVMQSRKHDWFAEIMATRAERDAAIREAQTCRNAAVDADERLECIAALLDLVRNERNELARQARIERDRADLHVGDWKKIAKERDDALARAETAEESITFMRDKYTRFGGRPCPACHYVDGNFQRKCKLHEEIDELHAEYRYLLSGGE